MYVLDLIHYTSNANRTTGTNLPMEVTDDALAMLFQQ